ncbi:MAG: HK97 gp10 family phage protein [Candidatus Diapherotrites archaeon]
MKLFIDIAENFNALVNATMREAADGIVVKIKENISPSKSGLNNRTGYLRESVKVGNYVQLTPNGEGQITILVEAPYAAVHEYGATIRAKNKPYLTFNINGNWVKKKEVTIPARPFASPAVDDVFQNIDELFVSKLEELINEL